MRAIEVPERGQTKVDARVLHEFSLSPLFWNLVDRKILAVEVTQSAGVQFKGACYVGNAIVEGSVIRVVEKVEGAFRAFCRAAWPESVNVVRTRSSAQPTDSTAGLLAGLFVDAVASFVARHRDFKYRTRADLGSLIGGRLDVSRTIGLRARGVRHQIAFDRVEITMFADLNVVLAAALYRIEGLNRQVGVSHEAAVLARKLGMLFSEIRSHSAMNTHYVVSFIVPRLLADPRGANDEVRELVELAREVLQHSGFGGDDPLGRSVGFSWFVNLETLFEKALRPSFRAVVGGEGVVKKPQNPPTIFLDIRNRYPANTDVVIIVDGATVVGDAKYKVRFSREWPLASEVHELLAHARAYRAATAFLAFPAEEFWSLRVGVDDSGLEVWCFGVSVLRLEDHVGRVWEILRASVSRVAPLSPPPVDST